MEQVGGAGASHLTGAGHQKLDELRRNWRNCAETGGTAQELENCRNWRNFPSKSPPYLVGIPCISSIHLLSCVSRLSKYRTVHTYIL